MHARFHRVSFGSLFMRSAQVFMIISIVPASINQFLVLSIRTNLLFRTRARLILYWFRASGRRRWEHLSSGCLNKSFDSWRFPRRATGLCHSGFVRVEQWHDRFERDLSFTSKSNPVSIIIQSFEISTNRECHSTELIELHLENYVQKLEHAVERILAGITRIRD